MVTYFCVLATVVVIVLALRVAECAPPTALFIFGDSLVDVGNNNNLRSLARANFKPNGIDYPGHVPTGRFCNGFLISDFLSQHWGLEATLGINDPNANGHNLLHGANFASAGAGILDDTGGIFVSSSFFTCRYIHHVGRGRESAFSEETNPMPLQLQRIRMSQQVQLFGEYVGNLTELVGESAAMQIVSGGLFSLNIGANDFLANYFLLPVTPRKVNYTLPEYQSLLISRLTDQIKEIYSLGARNIVIAGLGPIGCIPLLESQRYLLTKGNCIKSFQQVAISFNVLLKSMAEELQQEFPSSTFLYSNAFDMVYEMIQNPTTYGFEIANSACCGRGGKYRGLSPCGPIDSVCSNRSAYIFWDPFHPTERVNAKVAQRVLFGPPTDISPINLAQLFPI